MKESMEMLKEAERTGAVKIMIPVSELKFMLQQVSKVEEMQKTLEFYGNSDNWKLPSFGQGHSSVVSDRGERARQALKGVTNE